MGFYVNPMDESKQSFLTREGIVIPNNPKITWRSVPKGFLPVVVLYNGCFVAAGIAYCENELNEFTRIDNQRFRQIFMVRIEKLIPVAGLDFEQYARRSGLI